MAEGPPWLREKRGRILLDRPAEGAWNMSADEILLETSAADCLSLRFYEWSPATLSLGYFQEFQQRQEHAASQNCPVVRRASGGGAILHDRELTYSIVVPQADGARLDTRWLYDLMHDTLRRVLRYLGVNAHRCVRNTRCATGGGASEPFLCFQRHCDGDLLIGDHKVMGSAQRRSQSAVLQHGSILFQRADSAPELPGISDLSSQPMDKDQVRSLWIEEISRQTGLNWQRDEWTPDEQKRIEMRTTERFGHPSWTHRR